MINAVQWLPGGGALMFGFFGIVAMCIVGPRWGPGLIVAISGVTLAAQVLLAVLRRRMHREGLLGAQTPRWSRSQTAVVVLLAAVLVVSLGDRVTEAGFPIGTVLGSSILAGVAIWLLWAQGLDLILLARWRPQSLQRALGGDESLESFVGGDGLMDPLLLYRLVQEIHFQTCKVEAITATGGPALGSGLLIGPNLVLTCAHVVESAVQLDVEGSNVQVEFAGPTAMERSTFLAASEHWLVWMSPVDELDVAVIRLARAVDQDNVELPRRAALAPAQHYQRGYFDLAGRRGPSVQPRARVLLYHFPVGGPVRATMGDVTQVDETRFHHKATTHPGSSGAPCFDVARHLVGLHRQGISKANPDTNQAIRVDKLPADLANQEAHWSPTTASTTVYSSSDSSST